MINIIGSNKIQKSTLIVQLFTVAIILLSYFTTKIINIGAGIVCALFLLSKRPWEQRYALLYFLFPFASVFTIGSGSTSMLLILRIVMILAVLLRSSELIKTKMILFVFTFSLYCLIGSIDNEDGYIIKVLNVILWMLLVYFMQCTINEHNSLPVCRSLVNGTLLAALVGFFKEEIPGLMEGVLSDGMVVLSRDGSINENRFTGLFSDPNIYTLLLIISLWSIYCEFSYKRLHTSEFIIRSLLLTFVGVFTFSKSCILCLVIFWTVVLVLNHTINVVAKFFIFLSVFIGVYFFAIYNSDWLLTMEFRFMGVNGSSTDVDKLTTGRFGLWKIYIKYLYQTGSFVLGNGLNALLPKGRAAHNLILQSLYCIGVVGMYIYYKFFKYIYIQTPVVDAKIKGYLPGIWSFVSLCLLAFFLDLLLLETFYYMISMCFIYMKKTEKIL